MLNKYIEIYIESLYSCLVLSFTFTSFSHREIQTRLVQFSKAHTQHVWK